MSANEDLLSPFQSCIKNLKELFDKGEVTFEEILSELKENGISAPEENEEKNNLPKRVQKTLPEYWEPIVVSARFDN
jgi:hypothetical protein